MSNHKGVDAQTADLLDAFMELSRRQPDRPALASPDGVLDYGQLAVKARHLTECLGSAPGIVAVAAEHRPQTVIALLGVLAAGGGYCPVDPAHPRSRREAMVRTAGCRLLLGGGADLAAELGLEYREIESDAVAGPQDRQSAADDRAAAADSETPAYLLFTSGSTGRPKPVVTPRRAISASVGSLRDLFGLTPEDRVLQFASLNWDTCFEEILPALTAGAAVVFDPDAHAGSFPRFLRMIRRTRITVLDLPTAFWHELVLHLVESGEKLPDSLRLLVIGGEAAAPARLADWSRLDTAGIRLLNTYGCTETTLVTHAVDLCGPLAARPGAAWDAAVPAPIGRPLPHVRQRIGAEGELLVGGPGLATGYLGLPEATAARFTEVDGEFCFRTGDRVERGADGLLTHRGRLDGELKVRGVRVDPAEIEAQIATHPEVGAVAVAGALVAGRTTLLAYVVPAARARTTGLDTEVRSFLRGRVPEQLLPSRVTVVPRLVLTPSGKVDRAASHRRYAPPDQVKGDL
ncbi:amino acid adenylation domain-containing protein [Streptacidiphilus rugosus]|uniref:amino acid adenylation domain-containing protein n=1 Tax=Streptacidiphilus rugosus TaxID=405783 RepID=UPI00056C934D|nr:amino acid adenylation domain-containing protein [Streptacidiphilus rugosus]